jgi:hypothetical protein
MARRGYPTPWCARATVPAATGWRSRRRTASASASGSRPSALHATATGTTTSASSSPSSQRRARTPAVVQRRAWARPGPRARRAASPGAGGSSRGRWTCAAGSRHGMAAAISGTLRRGDSSLRGAAAEWVQSSSWRAPYPRASQLSGPGRCSACSRWDSSSARVPRTRELPRRPASSAGSSAAKKPRSRRASRAIRDWPPAPSGGGTSVSSAHDAPASGISRRVAGGSAARRASCSAAARRSPRRRPLRRAAARPRRRPRGRSGAPARRRLRRCRASRSAPPMPIARAASAAMSSAAAPGRTAAARRSAAPRRTRRHRCAGRRARARARPRRRARRPDSCSAGRTTGASTAPARATSSRCWCRREPCRHSPRHRTPARGGRLRRSDGSTSSGIARSETAEPGRRTRRRVRLLRPVRRSTPRIAARWRGVGYAGQARPRGRCHLHVGVAVDDAHQAGGLEERHRQWAARPRPRGQGGAAQ